MRTVRAERLLEDERVAWEMAAAAGSGFDPRESGAVSAWLRFSQGTVTGAGYSSVPDVLNSNPAVQATDANRPVNGTSANGLPIATFTDDFLAWPLANGSNNQSPAWGIAFWLRCTPDGTVRRIWSIRLPGASGGASDNRIEICSDSNASRGIFADVYNSTVTARRGAVQASFAAATWTFFTLEYDGAQGTEAGKLLITTGGTVRTLSFSDAAGAPGAMPATLIQPTGNAHLGAQTTAGGNPFVGDVGPNVFVLTRQLTAAERAALMGFEVPT
jgi:hypothetical protein